MFTLKNILLTLADTLFVALILFSVMCSVNGTLSLEIAQYGDLIILGVFSAIYYVVSLFERIDE